MGRKTKAAEQTIARPLVRRLRQPTKIDADIMTTSPTIRESCAAVNRGLNQ